MRVGPLISRWFTYAYIFNRTPLYLEGRDGIAKARHHASPIPQTSPSKRTPPPPGLNWGQTHEMAKFSYLTSKRGGGGATLKLGALQPPLPLTPYPKVCPIAEGKQDVQKITVSMGHLSYKGDPSRALKPTPKHTHVRHYNHACASIREVGFTS